MDTDIAEESGLEFATALENLETESQTCIETQRILKGNRLKI